MAGKTLSSQRYSTRIKTESGILSDLIQRGILREIAALSLLLGVAFLTLSLASYDPADDLSAVYPANESFSNLGGRIGAAIVNTCYTYFGVATYLLVGLLAVWGIAIFFRQSIKGWPLKILGALLALFAFSGFFGQTQRASLTMPSSGGISGQVLSEFLANNFGLTGTYLILSFVVAISMLLATDIMFYPLIRDFFSLQNQDESDLDEETSIAFTRDSTLVEDFSTASSSQSTAHEKDKGNLLRRIVHFFSKNSNTSLVLEDASLEASPDTTDSNSQAAIQTIPAGSEPARAKPKKRVKKQPQNTSSQNKNLKEQALAYTKPSSELLEHGKKAESTKVKREIEDNIFEISNTLKHFNIDVEVIDIQRGPTVTMYEIKVPPNLPVKKIVSREQELTMMLRAKQIRILAPIPGRNTVGIEVPNRSRDLVSLREVVTSPEFLKASKSMQLPLALGLDSEGKPMIHDLAKAPHLLISGTTGSGKSVMENIILVSLLLACHYNDVKLMLIDPKCVELSPYEDLGFLVTPVITDMNRAIGAFEWLVAEMEKRYDMFAKTRTKKITEFNETPFEERLKRYQERGGNPEDMVEKMPCIVAMVDELADLMMASGDARIDELICRIAQKARAAGIHLILATQRPSTDVVTGLIKANVPARIAFKLPSSVDSRTILSQTGAEKLLGRGDMLVDWNDGSGIKRAQSAFCDTPEITKITQFVREQCSSQYMIEEKKLKNAGANDDTIGGQERHPKLDQAIEAVLTQGRGSAQFIRSALRVGYSAATTLVMQMEMLGILGPSRGSKEREILMTLEEWQTLQDAPDEEYESDEVEIGESDLDVFDSEVSPY